MTDYEFTLKFSLQNNSINPEAYIDMLGSEGCNDALVGLGQNNQIALNFNREAPSAYDAISSAIADVRRAIPDAKLIEATPDFVGLTDVADILGFSRQNMRKLMVSSKTEFPMPIHTGKPSIWHLSQILIWLKALNKYQIEDKLIETAKINMEFNIAKGITESDPIMQKNIQRLIA